MEGYCLTKKSHKEWRRVAKRERRRRLRRNAAARRQADQERLRAALEKTAEYLSWLEKREIEEKEEEAREKEEHDERERLWLEEEARAQKEWQELQERKRKARQLQLEQEAKIREEFEAKQEAIRKKQEEEKRRREEDIRKREQLLKEIDEYIDDGIKTPEALREVIDSQPGKELCPFFSKTGACRYGDTCSRNHRRVCLSKVILVPGFYTHFSLEKNSAEYDTDVTLEFETSETRQHFREFYKDVVPELESFGRIKTLKYCCNTEIHLRGNLYVEYYTEREAARALRRLRGRWYAGRQLNCEFVNLKSWRSAVCGMSKCPKGRACNFLHTFKNPRDEYDIKSPPRWAKQHSTSSSHEIPNSRRSEHSFRSKSKWEDCGDVEQSKHWRWSESPEREVERRSRNTDKGHRYSQENVSWHKSSRDKRHEPSDGQTSARHRRSNCGKHTENKIKDTASNGRESFRKRSPKYQRKRKENLDCDASKSPKRSSKRHSSNSDGSRRSKIRRSSCNHSRRDIKDSEKVGQKSRNHGESRVDSPRRYPETAEKFNFDTGDNAKRATQRNVESKWDKEHSEQNDFESVESNDSDSSSSSEESRRRVDSKGSEDEWATTSSEDEQLRTSRKTNRKTAT